MEPPTVHADMTNAEIDAFLDWATAENDHLEQPHRNANGQPI